MIGGDRRDGVLPNWGLGCAPIGFLPDDAAGERQAAGVVETALAQGLRYFDTAPFYGLGRSERRLGAALTGVARAEYVISSKVGRRLDPEHERGWRWDFSRDGVLASLEQSLDRLGTDHLDIVFVHDPDRHHEEALEHAIPALRALVAEGVVGRVGVGMNQHEALSRFVAEGVVDVVLLAGRYTVLERGGASLLDECAAAGVDVVLGGVFNSGILASDPRHGTVGSYGYRPAEAEIVDRATRLAEFAERHGVDLPTLAIHFAHRHPGCSSVILGMAGVDEVREDVRRMTAELPDGIWTALDRETENWSDIA